MQPVESCCTANFNAMFFIKIALKLSYFCKKMQNFRALEAAPQTPMPPAAGGFVPRPPASGGWGLRIQIPIDLGRLRTTPPDPQNSPPPLRSFGYALGKFYVVLLPQPNFFQ